MKISKVILAPAAALAISALSLASCSANNQQSTVQSEPQSTEAVIQQAPDDTFEKQQAEKEKKEELPWWEKALGIAGFLAFMVGSWKLIHMNLGEITEKDLEIIDKDYYKPQI